MGIRFILILLMMPTALNARPVSYTGGSTFMLFADDMKNSTYYHYSPSYKYSLGIELVDDRKQDENYAYFRYTHLLDRKNTRHSQRNFYFQSGVSSQGLDGHFYGLHGDWETRRLFAGFGVKRVNTDSQDYTEQFLQFGFAPYLGNYGDLHSWLMVKTKRTSLTDGWHTYPVIKFFKGDYLFEMGVDENNQLDAHFMIRF